MLVTMSHLSGTVIQVSCDGYSGCTASFVATQPGAFDRECAEEFARAMGWVFGLTARRSAENVQNAPTMREE